MVDVSEPGATLLSAAGHATSQFIAVAPFVKCAALSKLLVQLDESIPITLVTRWNLPDLVAGVSDLGVWPLIAERGGRVLLADRLHAKIYVFDELLYVSSANVTHSGMGWRAHSNDEVLVRPCSDDERAVHAFVARLVERSVSVNDELHQAFSLALEELGENFETDEEDDPAAESTWMHRSTWIPESRDPYDAERCYLDPEAVLTLSSRVAAERDLLALNVPRNLTRQQFRAHVDLALLQMPLINLLAGELRTAQRFGAVVTILAHQLKLQHRDAAEAWQTLSRWLRHFQHGRWKYEKLRYSESVTFVPMPLRAKSFSDAKKS